MGMSYVHNIVPKMCNAQLQWLLLVLLFARKVVEVMGGEGTVLLPSSNFLIKWQQG